MLRAKWRVGIHDDDPGLAKAMTIGMIGKYRSKWSGFLT
jgi:hypothetical protein